MTQVLLGLDIGTTAVKGLLIDNEGSILAEASHPNELISRHVGWAEEDPRLWYRNTIFVIRRLLGQIRVQSSRIAAVGVSGMVPALVLVDEHDRPVRFSIQQNDARSAAELDQLRQQLDQDHLFQVTGSFLNQQHVAPRVMWVQQHEPEAWKRVRTIMGSYDYIVLRLTGRRILELNWAAESGLFDIRRRAWIDDVLRVCSLDASLLPKVHQPTAIVGQVSETAASETGLAPGTAVIAGSADHVASALSSGLQSEGDLLIKLGGAGDVLYCLDSLRTHPQLYIDFHDIPGKYLLNGCMATSGSILKWFVTDVLSMPADPEIFRRLDAEAERVPPGSLGLIALPYFLGEKTPIFDPLARGVFFGLTLSHERAHLVRAILEGVALGFLHHVEIIKDMGCLINRIIVTDGGARSSLWTQIVSDVLGLPLRSHPEHPGSALGVAFLAGRAIGAFTNWEAIEWFLTGGLSIEPRMRNHEIYSRAYIAYRRLYEESRPVFTLLRDIDSQASAVRG